MMGRLVRGLTALAACFAVATLIAQAIGLGFLWRTGRLDRGKALRVLAILQGVEPAPSRGGSRTVEQAPARPTPDEIEDQRSLALRAVELRELALRNGLAELTFERGRLAEEKGRFDLERTAFRRELDERGQTVRSTSQENVRLVWENMKPKQAKDQILLLLQDEQIEEVVTLLASMPAAKRAKIAGEFKTPEEARQLADILQRMREGIPDAGLIEAARQKLENPAASP